MWLVLIAALIAAPLSSGSASGSTYVVTLTGSTPGTIKGYLTVANFQLGNLFVPTDAASCNAASAVVTPSDQGSASEWYISKGASSDSLAITSAVRWFAGCNATLGMSMPNKISCPSGLNLRLLGQADDSCDLDNTDNTLWALENCTSCDAPSFYISYESKGGACGKKYLGSKANCSSDDNSTTPCLLDLYADPHNPDALMLWNVVVLPKLNSSSLIPRQSLSFPFSTMEASLRSCSACIERDPKIYDVSEFATGCNKCSKMWVANPQLAASCFRCLYTGLRSPQDCASYPDIQDQFSPLVITVDQPGIALSSAAQDFEHAWRTFLKNEVQFSDYAVDTVVLASKSGSQLRTTFKLKNKAQVKKGIAAFLNSIQTKLTAAVKSAKVAKEVKIQIHGVDVNTGVILACGRVLMGKDMTLRKIKALCDKNATSGSGRRLSQAGSSVVCPYGYRPTYSDPSNSLTSSPLPVSQWPVKGQCPYSTGSVVRCINNNNIYLIQNAQALQFSVNGYYQAGTPEPAFSTGFCCDTLINGCPVVGTTNYVDTSAGATAWALGPLKGPFSLSSTTWLQSGQGLWGMVMQDDGNLVVYMARGAQAILGGLSIWSTNTFGKGKGPYTLSLSTNCNLQITDSSGTTLWQTNTNSQYLPCYLGLDENVGVLNLTDSAGIVVWNSNNFVDPRAYIQYSTCWSDVIQCTAKQDNKDSFNSPWTTRTYPYASYDGIACNTGTCPAIVVPTTLNALGTTTVLIGWQSGGSSSNQIGYKKRTFVSRSASGQFLYTFNTLSGVATVSNNDGCGPNYGVLSPACKVLWSSNGAYDAWGDQTTYMAFTEWGEATIQTTWLTRGRFSDTPGGRFTSLCFGNKNGCGATNKTVYINSGPYAYPPPGSINIMEMQDNGNLVIKNNVSGSIIWQTGTTQTNLWAPPSPGSCAYAVGSVLRCGGYVYLVDQHSSGNVLRQFTAPGWQIAGSQPIRLELPPSWCPAGATSISNCPVATEKIAGVREGIYYAAFMLSNYSGNCLQYFPGMNPSGNSIWTGSVNGVGTCQYPLGGIIIPYVADDSTGSTYFMLWSQTGSRCFGVVDSVLSAEANCNNEPSQQFLFQYVTSGSSDQSVSGTQSWFSMSPRSAPGMCISSPEMKLVPCSATDKSQLFGQLPLSTFEATLSPTSTSYDFTDPLFLNKAAWGFDKTCTSRGGCNGAVTFPSTTDKGAGTVTMTFGPTGSLQGSTPQSSLDPVTLKSAFASYLGQLYLSGSVPSTFSVNVQISNGGSETSNFNLNVVTQFTLTPSAPTSSCPWEGYDLLAMDVLLAGLSKIPVVGPIFYVLGAVKDFFCD